MAQFEKLTMPDQSTDLTGKRDTKAPGIEVVAPRYVILEHRWNGIHWDLMLERDATLSTWAIDVPIQPGVRLPARRLPDHRLAYLDYEGEISRGRGFVTRFDAGTYDLKSWSDQEVVVELRNGRLTGILTLTRCSTQSDEERLFDWSFCLVAGTPE
jgi:hypothetical protein